MVIFMKLLIIQAIIHRLCDYSQIARLFTDCAIIHRLKDKKIKDDIIIAMPEVKLIRKFLKFSAIVLLIFLFGFSDIVSFFCRRIGKAINWRRV